MYFHCTCISYFLCDIITNKNKLELVLSMSSDTAKSYYYIICYYWNSLEQCYQQLTYGTLSYITCNDHVHTII